MKTILVILYFLLGIIALLLIVGLFVKKEYKVSREVLVNEPKETVFEYLKLLKNQNNFSVWAQIDPNMKKTFTGTDGTVGFVSAWESDNKNVGKGEQEILNIDITGKIDYEIIFIKPFKSVSYATMSTVFVDEDQTKVKWVFTGKMKYPMNLMLLFMNMEKSIGNDLQNGLNNLKIILEKQG